MTTPFVRRRPLRLVGALALLLASTGVAQAEDDKPDKPASRPTIIKVCDKELQLLTPEEIRRSEFPWIEIPESENAATWYVRGLQAFCAIGSDSDASDEAERALKHGVG